MKEKNPAQKKIGFLGDNGSRLIRQEAAPLPQKATFWYIMILFAAFPLVVGAQGYETIERTKFFAFAGLTVALAAVLLCTGRASLRSVRFGLPQLLLCGVLLLALVSLLCSDQPDLWMGQWRYEGFFSLLLYALAFLAVSGWGAFSDKYIYALGACMSVFCVICLLQLGGRSILSLPDFADSSGSLGTIGNVDLVSGLIALAVPLLAGAFLVLDGAARYVFCLPQIGLLLLVQLYIDVDSGKIGLLAAFALLVLLGFSDTRRIGRFFLLASVCCLSLAAYLRKPVLIVAAACFALVGVLLSRSHKELPLSPRTMRLLLLALFLLLAAGAFYFVFTYDGEIQILLELREALHGRLDNKAGSYRGYIWKNTLDLISEKPLLGSGPGSFYGIFAPFRERLHEPGLDFAHNDYLQIAAERGLLSLGLYLSFLLVLAVRALRVIDRNPLVMLFAASACGYLVHIFFSYSIVSVAPLFWVVIGLLDKCVKQTPKKA